MPMADLLRLLRQVTVARIMERDDFQKRAAEQRPISMLELLYPVMQGYDSVAVRADVELGGTDQKFNLLLARDVQQAYGQPPQSVLTMPVAPVQAKRELGRRIVARFWGEEAAVEAERHFDRVHKEHLPPEQVEEVTLSGGDLSDGKAHLPAVIAEHFGTSRSEARRLLGQGGAKLNGEPLGADDLDLDLSRLDGALLQVGRRQFIRLRVQE